MSSHMKNIADSAGKIFARAQQFTEEVLGQAEKTQYDDHFEQLVQAVEKNKVWMERILAQLDVILQPNPGEKIEGFIMSKMGQAIKEKPNSLEVLSQLMKDAANELTAQPKLADTLKKVSGAESLIGGHLKDKHDRIITGIMQPLKSFLEVDYKNLQKERKSLDTARLDLDSAKSKVRRAKPEHKETAEAELRNAQNVFDRQLEVTKLLLDQMNNSMVSTEIRSFLDLIDIEHDYHTQVTAALDNLKKSLNA